MSRYQIKSLKRLIAELQRLPGIGPRSAERIAVHILAAAEDKVRSLAEALIQVKEKVGLCERCFNFAEEQLCPVCKDPSRVKHVLCVVEKTKDLLLIESSGSFKGLYHVLHGTLSPLDGTGPDKLRFEELRSRVAGGEIKEVILATNPNVEGEATALFAQRLIKPYNVKVTRIACGVPVGSDLEFSDVVTLSRSMEGRREL